MDISERPGGWSWEVLKVTNIHVSESLQVATMSVAVERRAVSLHFFADRTLSLHAQVCTTLPSQYLWASGKYRRGGPHDDGRPFVTRRET